MLWKNAAEEAFAGIAGVAALVLIVGIAVAVSQGIIEWDKMEKEEASQQLLLIDECRAKGGVPLFDGVGVNIQLRDCKFHTVP